MNIWAFSLVIWALNYLVIIHNILDNFSFSNMLGVIISLYMTIISAFIVVFFYETAKENKV